eukprot:1551722-Amphidinium_carterae.1
MFEPEPEADPLSVSVPILIALEGLCIRAPTRLYVVWRLEGSPFGEYTHAGVHCGSPSWEGIQSLLASGAYERGRDRLRRVEVAAGADALEAARRLYLDEHSIHGSPSRAGAAEKESNMSGNKRKPAAVRAWEAVLQQGEQRQVDAAERLLRSSWVLPLPVSSGTPWTQPDGRWCEALVLGVLWAGGPGTPVTRALIAIPESAFSGDETGFVVIASLYLSGTASPLGEAIEEGLVRVLIMPGDCLVKRLADSVPREDQLVTFSDSHPSSLPMVSQVFEMLPEMEGHRRQWSSALSMPLSAVQRQLVGRLESTFLSVCRLGEELTSPSGGLSTLAELLRDSSGLGYGDSCNGKAAAPPVELNASNMSLPEIAGVVPLKHPVIPSVFQSILETPDIFLKTKANMPIRLPPWFMCVKSWPGIARQLLLRGLCRAVAVEEVQPWRGQHLRAGLFGVEKPQTTARRVIVDRRRRNAVERCLRQVVMEKALAERWPPEKLEHAWRLLTLPHGSQLGDIMCSPKSTIKCWSEDARDYFYLLRYAPLRHTETIVGYNVDSCDFTRDELDSWGVPAAWSSFALALVSPAMGDQKSMEVAQLCHQHVMLTCGGIQADGWLSYRWPFPPSNILAGCYCDDYGQIAIGADDVEDNTFSVQSTLDEARVRICHVHAGYRNSGLIRKEAKARAEESVMTLWGSTIDGSNKVVRGALEKVKPLLAVTAELLSAKTASSDEVSILLGHWTHHCLFRRASLCLLDEVYSWIRRDTVGTKRRHLGPRVRDELLGLLLLWPLLHSDMQAVPFTQVTPRHGKEQW